ncbi:putative Ig domain-containing protein [Leptospira sp. GIMC2001]|uniref:putative Ig domain-containing protein n=1 Tax=Leptospira sp. GIMC2001 TaxID=1513297 RepID=UPI002349897B|nr:putative Ig domain-containing protein [Leptospira sp. GIMC2001]WCL50545.1 putative Ig domain-containing protein [Leptospira sp. GIMC2001]
MHSSIVLWVPVFLISNSCNFPSLTSPLEYAVLSILLKNSNSEGSARLSNLSYSGSPFIFTRNTAIISITPNITGIAETFSVNPNLPPGLSIETTNGTISGTPTGTSNAITYTITASNSKGEFISTTISISVLEENVSAVALGIWTQEAYIKATNSGSNDEFGNGLSISGDTIVVSAQFEGSNQTTITNGSTASSDNSATNSGALYVFRRSGNAWAQEAYIKSSNSNISDEFGYSVAISGDTIVAGAVNEDSNQSTITNGATSSGDNTLSNSGAAYVFRRSGTTWAQEAYLKASNANAADQFGNSVAIDMDTIVIGSCAEDSNQTTITNGATSSVDNSSVNSGAAYVYKRIGSNWNQEAFIKASNADPGDSFCSVSISSDTIAVGSNLENSNQTTITNGAAASLNNGMSASGAVYIFRRSGTTWTEEAYIKASNAGSNDQFGLHLDISQDSLVVGSSFEDSNQNFITNGSLASSDNSSSDSGAAYAFKRTGSNWAQEAYIKASNNESGDRFGIRVAIKSDLAAVGSFREDSNQNTITNGIGSSIDNSVVNSGAVYIYKRNGSSWVQEAYIKASNPDMDDEFGKRLAISDDTLVVGATFEDSSQATITNGTTASIDNSALNSGAVYIYRRH